MILRQLIENTAKLRKKQYPVSKIGAVETRYVPSNKQLYIRAQAAPHGETLARSAYPIQIVFDGVDHSDVLSREYQVQNVDDKGNAVYLKRLSEKHNVRIRCGCADYRFMWSYYNKTNKALIGTVKKYTRKTTTYPERNPTKTPGACKHILGFIKLLHQNGILELDGKSQRYVTSSPRNYV